MKITVEVTQSDIENGTADSCTGCPIAMAIKRHLKIKGNNLLMNRVLVGGEQINICKDGTEYEGLIPEIAANFINTFDAKESPCDENDIENKEESVSPISFELTLNKI